MIAKIETEGLLELVWAAPAAALAVAITYSLVIYGSARASESRRAGHGGQATAYGALAVVAGLAFAAVVVVGVSIIVAKD